MKNTLTLIGAVAVAIAVIAAAAIIVKKYMEKTAVAKKKDSCGCECYPYGDMDFDADTSDDECFWDEVPVEEDGDDFGLGEDIIPETEKKDDEEELPF